MAIKSLLISILASSLSIVLAAPVTRNSAALENLFRTRSETCPGAVSVAPTFFTGPVANFPSISQWVSYTTMFNANRQQILLTGSTSSDVANINTAVLATAAAIGVDERVIFGIIMQESHGFVGVQGGGLMQDQADNCPSFPGQTNLPQADITNMVMCGTRHYKQNLIDFGNQLSTASILPALREYNSGQVDQNDLSDAPNCLGNPFYVSDISNRFLGRVF